jgi:hypothetical protein
MAAPGMQSSQWFSVIEVFEFEVDALRVGVVMAE